MKNLIFNKLILAIVFACFCISANSQNIYHLTLDSAIEIAKQKSHRILQLNENLNQAKYRLKSINRSYLPGIEFNGTLPAYSEQIYLLQDTLSSFYYRKDMQYRGELSLNQVLPTNGTLSLSAYGFNNIGYRDTSNLFQTKLGLRYRQPLQSFFFYNQRQADIKQAKLNYELTSKQFKREELNLIYNISNLFYNMVSNQKQLEIALQNLLRQEEANKLAKNKYETGLIKEVEALQIEVDYGEALNQLDLHETSLKQSENNLKMELGLDLKDSVVVTNSLDYKEILIDPEQAISLGIQNRTELKESQLQIDLTKLDIKRQRSYGLISGNLETYYDFYGSNQYKNTQFPYNEGFNSSINDMFRRSGNFGFSLTISIPILDWGANHQMVKLYQSRLKQNELSLDYNKISIENEIRNTVSRFNSSLRRLQLLEKNVKLAEKSFNISYLRFQNGDIDAEALGLDRSRYNNAQQSYLDAYISYKLLLLDLNRKTFFDFEKNTSLTSEP